MEQFALRFIMLVCALLATISRHSSAEGGGSKHVSFIRQVAPILVGKCQACHGPKVTESNYRLDTFDSLMQPGDFGTAPIAAGDLEESELYRLITAEDPQERMPNNGGRLADFEIKSIADWILQGAKFDGQDAAAPLRTQIPTDIPYPAAPQTYPATFPINSMTFTADGNQLVVGGYHELLIWDIKSGALAARIGNIPERTFGLAFSPDNSWLAIAGGSPGATGEVGLIPWQDGPKIVADRRTLATHDDVFFDVAFRTDGRELAAAGTDGSVRVFAVGSGVERLKINSHADWVTDICFSSDGKYIATASRDKTAKVFAAQAGELIATYSEHNAPVRAVAFANDDKTVISAGGNRVRIWNVSDSKLVAEMVGFEDDIYALLVHGESVVAAAADRSVRQFKLSGRTLIRALTKHPTSVLSLAWHEPSHLISTGCFDGTVTVWNLENGAMVKQFLAIPTGERTAN